MVHYKVQICDVMCITFYKKLFSFSLSPLLSPTQPSLQQHNVASFSSLPSDYKQSLLQQICGVVSERTGRLCTRYMCFKVDWSCTCKLEQSEALRKHKNPQFICAKFLSFVPYKMCLYSPCLQESTKAATCTCIKLYVATCIMLSIISTFCLLDSC